MNSIFINRQGLYLRPDPDRVIVRAFRPTTEPRDLNPVDKNRANHIVEHILVLDEGAVASQLAVILESFEGRHRNLIATFEQRAAEMENILVRHDPLSRAQRCLIGAYFVQEYSFEAAALFNPSIVPDPDQLGVPPGQLRFILSLRAVGEGHVSSLTFRSGIVDANGFVTIDPPARLANIPELRSRTGDALDLVFDPAGDIAERVIFPITRAQSNGIEDARFVPFEDGGEIIYYATFTAYNGRRIRSELLETRDFLTFALKPLRGTAAKNKGMALFPRKIHGRYAMITREDNESLSLVYSNDLHRWRQGEEILRPTFPWEFVQIGNCGSPIELDEGWLLFTHGVGPVRRYAIGAVLLDKDDPSKVLARSREPLVQPEGSERGGYVPNVVYTCGAMRHGELILLPYAVSDSFCNFATMKISNLLSALRG